MKIYLKIFIQLILFVFPWSIRRILLINIFSYKIHKSANIGLSIILCRNLCMNEGAYIGNQNFINEIDKLIMHDYSKIGKKNWITGSSAELKKGFNFSFDRKCELEIGEHTRITGNHLIDCNGGVYIGKFTTIAGNGSQILTHSVNIYNSRQTAGSVKIGDYCFIGTRSIMLMNSSIPSFSVLGAGSILIKNFDVQYGLYAGNPAKLIKTLPSDALYFHRVEGNII